MEKDFDRAIDNVMDASMALAVCFAVYKFVPGNMAKAMALGAAGAFVLATLPVVGRGYRKSITQNAIKAA